MLLCWKKSQDEAEEGKDLKVYAPIQDLYQNEIDRHVEVIESRLSAYLSFNSPPALDADIDFYSVQESPSSCTFKRNSTDIHEFYGDVIKELTKKPQIKAYLKDHQIKFTIHINSTPNDEAKLTGSLRLVSTRYRCACTLL